MENRRNQIWCYVAIYDGENNVLLRRSWGGIFFFGVLPYVFAFFFFFTH